MISNTQQQYIANLHDSFVKYINDTMSLINALMVIPQATEADKKVFDTFKGILHSYDVEDVKRRLCESPIRRSTLDKMEKVYKDHVDFAIEHLHKSPLFKQFWKQISHTQIEKNKSIEIQRLNDLGIPIEES